MKIKKRWVLLRHTDSPDDKVGIHYDLLLEEKYGCRTWRLSTIPTIDGERVIAFQAPLHKLEWLDKVESVVSGGRGWASRVANGTFHGCLPNSDDIPLVVNLYGETIAGRLEIKDGYCIIVSS